MKALRYILLSLVIAAAVGLLAYEIIAVKAENYEETYGDVQATFTFATPYADEVAILKKNGLVLSQAHAPFPAYVHTCPQMLDYAIEVYKKCNRSKTNRVGYYIRYKLLLLGRLILLL